MDRLAVAEVRAFNRTVAERIGALTDEFLGRQRPMGESRILWEIGEAGLEVRELRSRLGLDSGYTTRVLQSLGEQGLITVKASSGDRRVRHVRLTAAGQRERAELDQLSDGVAWAFLEPLDQGQRDRLVKAMGEVERLLRASLVRLAVEDPAGADARWCVGQYFAELNSRFDAGFDPAGSIPADAHELVPPAGAFVIARLKERPIGCGALKLHPGEPAELKRMWVSPDSRGLGVGRRLLVELERLAKEGGARTAQLETNRTLKEAIQLYRESGYHEVKPFNSEPYAHHWFEKDLL